MIINRFDSLPVEIIHTIFKYLSAYEILQAFSNINSHFDGVLSTYPYYRLNFKSISRANFDLICERIKPNQVVSLILSDLADTPRHSELFFSRFQITDFNRLQMLKLIDIEYGSMKHIDPFLQIFNNHHKLSIQLHYSSPFRLTKIFAYATQIEIDELEVLGSDFLPYLRCLTVSGCSIVELQTKCLLAKNLTSIKVNNLFHEYRNSKFSLFTPQLKRLVLHCEETFLSISMNKIEQLLLNLPRLKYFEISCKGSSDLANGQSWEQLTDQLVTFDFNFRIDADWIETGLDSFRTPFWIEEKKWFVACAGKRIFTVPHFFTTTADSFFDLSLDTTMPNKILLLDKVNHFILNDSSIFPRFYFYHVKTLEIRNADFTRNLSTLIDLNHVENLILSTPTSFSLLESIPAVKKISFNTKLRHFLDQTENCCFKQIRILAINEPMVDGDFYAMEQLVRVFPNVEVLKVNSDQWKFSIPCLIDKFPNLSSASFQLKQPSTTNEQCEDEISMTEYITDEIGYLNRESYTCKHELHITSTFVIFAASFHFWIRKPKKSLLNQYGLPERGSKYYYLHKFLEHNVLFRIIITLLQFQLVYLFEYNILKSTNPLLILIIQLLFLFALGHLQRIVGDPLISKLIRLFLGFLFMLVCYMQDATGYSYFYHSVCRSFLTSITSLFYGNIRVFFNNLSTILMICGFVYADAVEFRLFKIKHYKLSLMTLLFLGTTIAICIIEIYIFMK